MELLLRDKEAALQQTTAKDRERKKVPSPLPVCRAIARVSCRVPCVSCAVCRACRVVRVSDTSAGAPRRCIG